MISNLDAFYYILTILIFISISKVLIKKNLKSVIELKDKEFFYKNSFIEAVGGYSDIKKISVSKNFFGVVLHIEGDIEVRQKFLGTSARKIIQIPDLSEEVARKFVSDINRKILEVERFQSDGGGSRS